MKKLLIIPVLFFFLQGQSQSIDTLLGIKGKLIKDTALSIPSNYLLTPTSTSLSFDSSKIGVSLSKNATRDSIRLISGNGSILATVKDSSGGGSTPPAGLTGYIQYNNGGAFAASANLFWDNTNGRLGIGTATPSYLLDLVQSTNGVARASINNSNSGTSAQATFQATNGTASFQAGVAGTNYSTLNLTSANAVYFQANNASQLLLKVLTNSTTNAPIVFAGGVSGEIEKWRIDNNTSNFSNTGAAGTAYVNLKAGTTTDAQLHLTGGVAPTSPTDGDIWYETTNSALQIRRSSATYQFLTTNSINTVSPTSPNRTITIVINGSTYYIAAKTTND